MCHPSDGNSFSREGRPFPEREGPSPIPRPPSHLPSALRRAVGPLIVTLTCPFPPGSGPSACLACCGPLVVAKYTRGVLSPPSPGCLAQLGSPPSGPRAFFLAEPGTNWGPIYLSVIKRVYPLSRECLYAWRGVFSQGIDREHQRVVRVWHQPDNDRVCGPVLSGHHFLVSVRFLV